MHQHKQLLWFAGFLAHGDIGNFTLYRSRRGALVMYAKTRPGKPPTADQETQRDLFCAAAAAWNALTSAQRQEWTRAAARASLTMTGYDLWMHWHLTGDTSAMETLERQTHTTLLA